MKNYFKAISMQKCLGKVALVAVQKARRPLQDTSCVRRTYCLRSSIPAHMLCTGHPSLKEIYPPRSTDRCALYIHSNTARTELRTVAWGSTNRRRIWKARLQPRNRLLSQIPTYDNVKTRLCQERRKVPGTEKNPEDTLKTVFLEEVLRLANNSSFLQIDHTDDSCLRWGREWIFTHEAEFLFSGRHI
jgi:hypothetical protein